MAVPPGYALFIPSALRKAIALPVVGVGRFKDPLQADRALAEGHCDLVGIVRGQIADPDFAAKARAGAAEAIRLCLSCNQECVGRMGLNRWLGCIESPRTGRESEPEPGPAERPLRVLVVGAGPAGMQAAIAYKPEINGRKVQLIVLDDGSDPTTAGRNARKLIEEEKLIKVPATLDLTPYRDEKDFGLLRRLVHKEKRLVHKEKRNRR